MRCEVLRVSNGTCCTYREGHVNASSSNFVVCIHALLVNGDDGPLCRSHLGLRKHAQPLKPDIWP